MIENTHAKKAFFFHTESLTQGKIFSNNSAVNSQCLQGQFFFFVSFLFLLFLFSWMSLLFLYRLFFFFGFATVISTNNMIGPHPCFLFNYLSRPSESSELTRPHHSANPPPPPDLCPMSVQSVVEFQGGRGLDCLFSPSLRPDPPSSAGVVWAMKNELHHVCKKKNKGVIISSFLASVCHFFCMFYFY